MLIAAGKTKKRPLASLICLGVLSWAHPASADTATFNAGAGQTWMAPAGVTSVQVECWGAGGAGGSARNASSVNDGGSSTMIRGGGGGGGGYIKVNSVAVTPGNTYTFTVPAGAVATSATAQGQHSDGSDTTFTGDSVSVIAKGGLGGGSSYTNDSVVAGNGALGTAGLHVNQTGGDVVFQGGNGAAAVSAFTGGGGGGAGDNGNGANGVNNATTPASGGAGIVNAGGNGGGSRSTTDNPGNNATSPGGGGGGAKSATAGGDRLGGTGGDGRIVLTWIVPSSNTYKSVATGNWSDTSTWNVSTDGGATWGAAAAVPDNTAVAIFITNNFTVTVDVASTASALLVDTGSTLILNATLNSGSYSANVVLDGVLNNALSASQAFGGIISGVGTITNSGTGVLILSGANTYTGSIGIGAGALQLSGLGQLGGGNYSGNIINDSAFVYASSAAQTINGVISGIGSLTNSGIGGTLTLSAANTFSGGTTVSAGRIRMGNDNALGSGSVVTMSGGAISSVGSTARTLPVNLLITGGTMTLGDTNDYGTLTLNGGVDFNAVSTRTLLLNSDVIASSPMTNGGFQVKNGPGALTVKNQSTEAQQITQNQGDVIVDGGSLINIGTVNNNGWRMINTISNGATMRFVVTNGGSFTMTNMVNGAFRLGQIGEATNALYELDIDGQFSVTAVTADQATTNNTSVTGVVFLGRDQGQATANLLSNGVMYVTRVLSGGAAASELNLNGGTIITSLSLTNFLEGLDDAFVQAGGVTFDSAGQTNTINQPLLAGPGNGGLTKVGNGTIILGGVNTYTGNTIINAGTLALGASGSIANSSLIQVSGDATLDVSALPSGLTLGDNQTLKAAGTTSIGTITTGSGADLTLGANSGLVFNGFNGTIAPLTISGSGSINLTSGNVVAVTNVSGSAFGAGDYKLISKDTGSVAGTAPASVAVAGNGIASGMAASLQINSGELFLHIASGVSTNAVSITNSYAGGNLTLSWPADHIGWSLQVQTNSLAVGLSTNWFVWPGSAATNMVTIPVSANNPSVFYRLTYHP